MDKKLKENIIVGIKIVGMLFFLIVLNSISNKKLNINLYYKFSSKIPSQYNWYSLNKNNEFIPSFTKKIFKQILHLY